MRYLDICSGYSAPTVAWSGLGFECAGYSEIEAFPRAVLEQRHGAVPVDWHHQHRAGGNIVPLFGDFTRIQESHVGPVQLLVGGTPCQSFSVAGKRLGLDDPRGHLTLEYLALARRLRPRWVLWENVPGVLSDDGGRTLGTFLRILGELGYGWAYRVLDAQYIRVGVFGRAVPQRRRRVFVVGCLGDAARARAVLFDRSSLRGDPAPRREAGKGASGSPSYGIDSDCIDRSGEGADGTSSQRSGLGIVEGFSPSIRAKRPNAVAHAVNAHHHGRMDVTTDNIIAHAFAENSRAEIRMCDGDGAVSSQLTTGGGKPGQGQSCIAFAMRGREDGAVAEAGEEGVSNALRTTGGGSSHAFVAHATHDVAGTMMSYAKSGGDSNRIDNAASGYMAVDHGGYAVRRLTPTECERLQGLPDGFTAIAYRGKPAADGPRYKAIGNSMAVNVMRWIGERIMKVDSI